MKGLKIAAALCLLILPGTVFAAQADRPQHPKTAVSSTQHEYVTQTTSVDKTSVSASHTKMNIPADVKIVDDLGNNFSKSSTISNFRYSKDFDFISLNVLYIVCSPYNHIYVSFTVDKTYSMKKTTTSFHISTMNNTEIALKSKKSPYFVTINRGMIQKKQLPQYDHFSTYSASYKLPQNFFADAVNADETYIEFDGTDDNKIWVKIPQDVVAQFNEVFKTDLKKKIRETE